MAIPPRNNFPPEFVTQVNVSILPDRRLCQVTLVFQDGQTAPLQLDASVVAGLVQRLTQALTLMDQSSRPIM